MKKKMMAALICAFVVFSFSLVSAETVKLRLSTVVPPQGPPVALFLKPWADLVKKESQGTLEIEVYPGGVLGGNITQYFEQIDSGVFDIGMIYPAYFGDRFPWVGLFNIPFTAETYLEGSLSSQRMFDKGLFPGLENYRVLTIFGTTPFYFFTTFPVKLPEDLKGHKGRSGSKFQSDLFAHLGMTPIAMEFTKTTESMSRGLIDATIASPFVGTMMKTDQIARNVLELPVGNTCILVAMNKEKYENLPPPAKDAIDKLSGEWLARYAAETMEAPDVNTLEKFRKDPKMTVFKPTGEILKRWEEAFQPVIDKWKNERPENAMILETFHEEIRKIRTGK